VGREATAPVPGMDGDDEKTQTSSRSSAGMQRSRNVDVGWRIGRDLEAEASKPKTLEEQERLVAARREGDATTQKALQMLEECKAMREFDRTPCLPGFWTPGLHDRVIECLDRINSLCIDAKDLLKRGNALDRLDALQEVCVSLFMCNAKEPSCRCPHRCVHELSSCFACPGGRGRDMDR